MKKKFLIVLALLAVTSGIVFAQDTTANPNQLGVDSAQQRLKEISVSKFEDPGFWRVAIPSDHGIIIHRRFEGNPQDKQAIAAEADVGIKEADQYVLGLKVEYYNRVSTSISIESMRPLAVPGITKTLSMWVVGRNFNHVLKVVIQDIFGRKAYIPLGKLNFSGWKKMTVAIPPTVQQRNVHYNNLVGIKILGFVLEPDMLQTIGSYFLYMDDLRVVTDLFAEENRDADDIADNW